MAAFTGYDPIDAERQKSKYGNYDPSGLQRLDPRNAPAAQPAASRGALQAGPSPASSPAFAAATGDEGKGAGEARKPGATPEKNQFFEMWKEGDEEDRLEIANQQQKVFNQKGLSLEGATKLLFEQGGEVAARLGAKYGLVPPASKEGMPAFKPQEQALAEYEDRRKGESEKREREKKAAMGGFLMEMGLRILASNRQDAAGAIGEGALGTMDARRQRAIASREAGIAEAERKRKANLEERAMRTKEMEAGSSAAYNYARAADEAKPELVKITDKDGKVIFVKEEEGWVVDENGEFVREATDSELSRAQKETNRRARSTAISRSYNRIMGLDKYEREDLYPSLEGLTGKKLRDEVERIAKEEADKAGYGNLDTTEDTDVVDYSSL